MTRKYAVVCFGAMLVCGSPCSAQSSKPDILPPTIVPIGLEPYADVALVAKNAKRVFTALSSATFISDDTNQLSPDCGSPEVSSFLRGYLLAISGYNLFLALQELGVPRLNGPYGDPLEAPRRKWVQFGRSAVLSAWTPNKLGQVLELRRSLTSLPTQTRNDLASFVAKLREYRQHYARLRKAKPDLLEELFKREGDAYTMHRAYLEREKDRPDDKFSHEMFLKIQEMLRKSPPGIAYDELSSALDEQLRQVSDLRANVPALCYVGPNTPLASFPSESLTMEFSLIYPTKFMVSFWRRRDMEGVADLTDYILVRVQEALRSQ